MPIQHDPKPGDLLRCDYTFKACPTEPEMVKVRPVIVVAVKTEKLCIVVPISTVEPLPLRNFHNEMDTTNFPQHLRKRCWAKCDMISTVAHFRLDRYFKADQYGKRKHVNFRVSDDDLTKVRQCLRNVFGFA